MDYLESNFYIGIQDGINGTTIEDVIEHSLFDNEVIERALKEYRAGVVLGSVMRENGDYIEGDFI